MNDDETAVQEGSHEALLVLSSVCGTYVEVGILCTKAHCIHPSILNE